MNLEKTLNAVYMLLLRAYFYCLMKIKGLLVIIGLYIGVGEVEN